MRLSARTVTLATASALVGAAFVAPFLSSRAPLEALWMRWFFAAACHQRPERSFVLWGAPLAVCVRCFGIYSGAAMGSWLRLRPRFALNACAAALVINCVDVASEMAGLHGNLPSVRLALGIALGLGAGALLSGAAPAPRIRAELPDPTLS